VKLVFSADDAALEKMIEEIESEISKAAAGAVNDAAKEAVKEGRANIAGAGFSERWQRGFTYRFYPNKGEDPAALVYHKIGLASVFERGITIAGRPLLWLPIEKNLPAGVHSPRQYGKKLVSVNIAGKPPLLFDANDRLRGPLFIGERSVSIRKRFDLYRIIAAAAEHMRKFYEQRIKGF
jgi:hypothetical protein